MYFSDRNSLKFIGKCVGYEDVDKISGLQFAGLFDKNFGVDFR